VFTARLYHEERISRNRYLKNELIFDNIHLEVFYNYQSLMVFGEIMAVYCECHIQ
jgi:hypothetical protein